MDIKTVKDFETCLKNGSYAWPGGYPIYYVCHDGATLCPKCVNKYKKEIKSAIKSGDKRDSWNVAGCDINFEDENMICEQCNKQIPSAYGEE